MRKCERCQLGMVEEGAEVCPACARNADCVKAIPVVGGFRRRIAIAAVGNGNYSSKVFSLCSDGTLWGQDGSGGAAYKLDDIPQPEGGQP